MTNRTLLEQYHGPELAFDWVKAVALEALFLVLFLGFPFDGEAFFSAILIIKFISSSEISLFHIAQPQI